MNAGLIIAHTLAVLLLMMAFRSLALLYDISLLEAYLGKGKEALEGINSEQIVGLIMAQRLVPFIGLIIGVLTSFLLVKRRKHTVRDAWVVLVLALLMYAGRLHEKLPSLSLAKRMTGNPIAVIILDAALLLGIGFWIYFSRNNVDLKSEKG